MLTDGVATADPLTVEWLDGLSASGGDQGDGMGSGNAELLEAFDAARQTLAGGDVRGAVQTFQRTPVDASMRSHFLRDLYAADLCFAGTLPHLHNHRYAANISKRFAGQSGGGHAGRYDHQWFHDVVHSLSAGPAQPLEILDVNGTAPRRIAPQDGLAREVRLT